MYPICVYLINFIIFHKNTPLLFRLRMITVLIDLENNQKKKHLAFNTDDKLKLFLLLVFYNIVTKQSWKLNEKWHYFNETNSPGFFFVLFILIYLLDTIRLSVNKLSLRLFSIYRCTFRLLYLILFVELHSINVENENNNWQSRIFFSSKKYLFIISVRCATVNMQYYTEAFESRD